MNPRSRRYDERRYKRQVAAAGILTLAIVAVAAFGFGMLIGQNARRSDFNSDVDQLDATPQKIAENANLSPTGYDVVDGDPVKVEVEPIITAQAIDEPPAGIQPSEGVQEPEPTIIETVQISTETESEPVTTFAGTYTITAYCGCEACCGAYSDASSTTATGVAACEGVTVATCWSVLPAGATICIEGLGTYTVQDRVADWISDRYTGMIIDVYFADHAAAEAFGKTVKDVYLVE